MLTPKFLRLIAFLLGPCLLADPVTASAFSDTLTSTLFLKGEGVRVRGIKIPARYGVITDSWSGLRTLGLSNVLPLKASSHSVLSPRPSVLVVLIQDLHGNVGVQRNIAEIIKYLNKRYGLQTVCVEGAKGPFDVSVLRNIKNQRIRRLAVDHFLGENKLIGSEIAAVESAIPLHLWGVDDRALYLKNLEAFYEASRRSPVPHPKHPAWQIFYEIAQERNSPLTLNALAHVNRLNETASRPELISLVVGGYHTKGITALFKTHQVPFVVVTPVVQALGHEHQYVQSMQEMCKAVRRDTLQRIALFASTTLLVLSTNIHAEVMTYLHKQETTWGWVSGYSWKAIVLFALAVIGGFLVVRLAVFLSKQIFRPLQRPPELETVTILPGKENAFQALRDSLVRAYNETEEDSTTDLRSLVAGAREINPDFSTAIPADVLDAANRPLVLQFNNELNWRVFFPANEVGEIIGSEKQAVYRFRKILPRTWRRRSYLGTEIWTADFTGGQQQFVTAGLAHHRLAFTDPEQSWILGLYEKITFAVSRFAQFRVTPPLLLHDLAPMVEWSRSHGSQAIGSRLVAYEELRHAQDAAYVDLWHRHDLRWDMEAALKVSDAILKPEAPLRNLAMTQGFNSPHSSERLKSAGDIRELAGKWGGLLLHMKDLLDQKQYGPAYGEFLFWLCAMEDKRLMRSDGSNAESARLFEALLGASGYNASEDLVRMINRNSEFDPHYVGVGTQAYHMMLELYAANFWTDEERRERLETRQRTELNPPSTAVPRSAYHSLSSEERRLFIDPSSTEAEVREVLAAFRLHQISHQDALKKLDELGVIDVGLADAYLRRASTPVAMADQPTHRIPATVPAPWGGVSYPLLKQRKEGLQHATQQGEAILENPSSSLLPSRERFRQTVISQMDPDTWAWGNWLSFGPSVFFSTDHTPRWDGSLPNKEHPVSWGMYSETSEDAEAAGMSRSFHLDGSFQLKGVGIGAFPISIADSPLPPRVLSYGANAPSLRVDMDNALGLGYLLSEVWPESGIPDIGLPLRIKRIHSIPYQGQLLGVNDYFLELINHFGTGETLQKIVDRKKAVAGQPPISTELISQLKLDIKQRYVTEFLEEFQPAQLLVFNASPHRLQLLHDLLMNGRVFNDYLSLHGLEPRRMRQLEKLGYYTALADRIFQNILPHYRQPDFRSRLDHFYTRFLPFRLFAKGYLKEIWKLNRESLDKSYFDVHMNLARIQGTLAAVGGFIGKESFLPRNVGLLLKDSGKTLHAIVHDFDSRKASIPNETSTTFDARKFLDGVYDDCEAVARSLNTLDVLFGVNRKTTVAGNDVFFETLGRAVEQTHKRIFRNKESRVLSEPYIEAYLQWLASLNPAWKGNRVIEKVIEAGYKELPKTLEVRRQFKGGPGFEYFHGGLNPITGFGSLLKRSWVKRDGSTDYSAVWRDTYSFFHIISQWILKSSRKNPSILNQAA